MARDHSTARRVSRRAKKPPATGLPSRHCRALCATNNDATIPDSGPSTVQRHAHRAPEYVPQGLNQPVSSGSFANPSHTIALWVYDTTTWVKVQRILTSLPIQVGQL